MSYTCNKMKMQMKLHLDRILDIQKDPPVRVHMATTLIENVTKYDQNFCYFDGIKV